MSDRSIGEVFNGLSGLTCDVFIRTIRQAALIEGQPKNDEWIAQHCASRLEGPALRWYEDLPEETQENWKLLRRAILIRWPETEQESVEAPNSVLPLAPVPVPSSSAPAPAAAAPVPMAVPTVPTPSTLAAVPAVAGSSSTVGPGQMIQGNIKVLSAEGVDLGFVSKLVSTVGHASTCQNIKEALLVQFTPTLEPHEIMVVPDPNSKKEPTKLGITWGWGSGKKQTVSDAMLDGVAEFTWGGITFVDYDQASSKYVGGSNLMRGRSHCHVWNVMVDGTLMLTWIAKPGVRSHLSMNMTNTKRSLNFAFDHNRYVAKSPTAWTKIRLVFQAV